MKIIPSLCGEPSGQTAVMVGTTQTMAYTYSAQNRLTSTEELLSASVDEVLTGPENLIMIARLRHLGNRVGWRTVC